MQKIHKTIQIDAPREKVWEVMFDKDQYAKWTEAFHAGSRFEGDWSEGSKMLFIGPDEESGKEMGMVSRIAENRAPEFMSIEHLGIYADGVEDTTSDEARKWSPAFENYTLNEKDGGTELVIDQDMQDEYFDAFSQMWDGALKNIKDLIEGR